MGSIGKLAIGSKNDFTVISLPTGIHWQPNSSCRFNSLCIAQKMRVAQVRPMSPILLFSEITWECLLFLPKCLIPPKVFKTSPLCCVLVSKTVISSYWINKPQRPSTISLIFFFTAVFCSLMTLIQITQTVLTYLQRSQLVLGNPSLCVIFEYLTAASLFFGCIHWCPSVLSQRYKILERFQQVSVFTGVLRERLMVTADYDAERRGSVCARECDPLCSSVWSTIYVHHCINYVLKTKYI